MNWWWDGTPYPVVKHPNDLFVYQEIIGETQPELVIETGTYAGGSALFLACCLGHSGLDGRVITIDIEPLTNLLPFAKDVRFVGGMSSVDPAALEIVREEAEGKRTMVILDSDHRQAHVLAELKAYAPLVSEGCYLVVEDTHPLSKYIHPRSTHAHALDGYPAGAIKQWNPDRHGFEVDKKRERLLFSQNPGGYLRKKEKR
jgi:cephalosporin hydroxylase